MTSVFNKIEQICPLELIGMAIGTGSWREDTGSTAVLHSRISRYLSRI